MLGYIYRQQLCHTPPNPSPPPPTPPWVKTNVGTRPPSIPTQMGRTAKERGSATVELEDLRDHIASLRQVALATQKLANLLGGQPQGLSRTIPVLRGFQAVCLQSHSRDILA